MIRLFLIIPCFAILLSGCVNERTTEPPRAATEELLISTAVDRAAARLRLTLAPGTRIFVDGKDFAGTDAKDGDAKYAVAAITDRFLRQGFAVAPDPKTADVIVALRSGALSIDEKKVLFGIPAVAIPIPFAGTIPTPEVALYSLDTQKGIAKFAATGYGARDGLLRTSTGSVIGVSKHAKKVILIMFGSTKTDLLPPQMNEK